MVTLSERKFKTTQHIKTKDCHQYLHCTSSNPEHTKRSVVFCQTLRMSRICSEENDFKYYRSQMKSWLRTKGGRLSFVKRDKNNYMSYWYTICCPLQLKHLGKIINQNFSLLNMNDETKRVFSSQPKVLFKSPRIISTNLVRTKLYRPDRVEGSTNVVRNVVQYTCMSLKWTHLPAVLLTRHIK